MSLSQYLNHAAILTHLCVMRSFRNQRKDRRRNLDIDEVDDQAEGMSLLGSSVRHTRMEEEEYGGDYYEGKRVYFHNKGMLGAYLFILLDI